MFITKTNSCSLTKVCCIKNSVVIDPCCGSGGLLLKFAKILGKENVKDGFYGQEINLTTYNLARINMFLHDINYNKFNIARGDTLMSPKHWNDEPFDAIVSNPPYSIKWEGKSNPLLISDERFAPAGILAPESKADLAFTMHMLSWLSAKGTAAIVEFPGVLYRSNEKGEPGIRRYLVENNFIDTIIQLPENLFFGPSIATCIIVLKKNKKDNSILFVDASDEFIKPGKKNKLTDDNINNILELLKSRTNVEGKSILVPNEEILKDKDVNISVGTFLKTIGEKTEINIHELNKSIQEIVTKQSQVREELDAIIRELESDYNE